MVVGVHGLPDDDGRLKEYVPGFDESRFAAHERFFVEDVPPMGADRGSASRCLPSALRCGEPRSEANSRSRWAFGIRMPTARSSRRRQARVTSRLR